LAAPPYGFIADGLRAGDVIPFFGAAASAVYRPPAEEWDAGKSFMPFGGELASALAKAANYPIVDVAHDRILSELQATVCNLIPDISPADATAALSPILRRHVGGPPSLALVASWAEHVQGNRRALDRRLRQCFSVNGTPGLLHTKLAAVAATQLYITTNYDNLLEQALAERRPHIIVDRGGDQGFWIGVEGRPFQQASGTGPEFYDLLNDPITLLPSRPIVFKMHGSIDKTNSNNDCYLITEEDYVDFLGRVGGSYIPPYINGLMEGKDLLFLGYSLLDWNVRVILRKLLRRPKTRGNVRFWAIVSGRSDVEQEIWQAHDLNIYPMDLLEFADELARHL
jgi:hypothetical protein